MKRRQFTPEQKVNIVLDYLQSGDSITSTALRYNVDPSQISRWKQQIIQGGLHYLKKETPTQTNKEFRALVEKHEQLLYTVQLIRTTLYDLLNSLREITPNFEGMTEFVASESINTAEH